jgi:transposase
MQSVSLNGRGSAEHANPAGFGFGGLAPQTQSSAPNPELVEKAKRRRFTAAYKLNVIKQADACTGRGELGALLRREGLFASTLAKFRRQQAEGLLSTTPTGAKPRASKDPAAQVALSERLALEREVRQLRRKLARAERIIGIQKKAAIFLGETFVEIGLDEEEEED